MKLEEELAGGLRLVWKSFLLRPYPKPRSPEKFREYTQSWLRPAGEPDAGRFRPWSGEEPSPSHSVPPLVACKAAARLGAFDRYHLAVMDAYFYGNRNVTDRGVLVEVAESVGLEARAFEDELADPRLVEEVMADHNEAVSLGVTGVPAVVVPGGLVLPGAQDLTFYRRLVQKLASM